MQTITTTLKSRTFWTLVAGFIINVSGLLTVNKPELAGINGLIVLIATYFHLNPSQSTQDFTNNNSNIGD